MELENPAFLNACYVQKILRNAEQDESIEVSGITVKAATAKGDNYGSDMHRVDVEFSRVQDGHPTQRKQSLIVKVMPQGDIREEMIEAAGIFVTELSMMSVTLPKMWELLENVCSGPLSAQCLYIQHEKPTHLVIEDLAPRGFQMADRHAGMDLDHCLLAVRNLGIFHAASIALKEKDPTSFTKYGKGMLHKDQTSTMSRFFNSGAQALAEEAAKWPELSPRIVEKLLKIPEVLFETGCKSAYFREDDFNVLNHGDFWVNNMLFRYNEQRKPIDHIFVDFQISNYGSPAIDILYFFGTSPTNEVRLRHRELLLQEYHASLSSNMAKLKCNTEVLSFEKLQDILKERAFCEVVASMTVLPVALLEKGDEIDFTEMVKDMDKYTHPGYRGKTYRKIMTELLPWFDSTGLLDV